MFHYFHCIPCGNVGEAKPTEVEAVLAWSKVAGGPRAPMIGDTPKTDAFIAQLEKDLGDGPPCISEAAIDVIVRSNLIEHSRKMERELNDAKAAMQDYIAQQVDMDEDDYRRDPVNQPENIR